MNTRLLRITRVHTIGGRSRLFVGLGGLQPTLLSFEHGILKLRIEDVAKDGRCCWRVLPMPRYKTEAKRLIGVLVECAEQGKRTPTAIAWDNRA